MRFFVSLSQVKAKETMNSKLKTIWQQLLQSPRRFPVELAFRAADGTHLLAPSRQPLGVLCLVLPLPATDDARPEAIPMDLRFRFYLRLGSDSAHYR